METQSENNTGPVELLTDEFRMVAMFSHFSILFGSLVIPIVFWIIYKQKSKFAAFHAMQSLVFHCVYFFVMVFLVIIVSVVIILSGSGGNHGSPVSPPNVMQIILMLIIGIAVLSYVFGSIGYAVYIGIRAYKGELKKYPVIGNIVYNKIFAAA